MFSMQGTAEETQRYARQNQGLSFHKLWIVWLIIIVYVGLICYFMWQDDEIRLYRLHSATQFFQRIATVAGTLAIECEHRYYEHAELLH